MKINDPQIVSSVTAAFNAYEQALITNDVRALDRLFWQGSAVVRYGTTENLYGPDAIASFRRTRSSEGLNRRLTRTVVTTFGDEFATVWSEFVREGKEAIGRQAQVWVQFPEGWRVVAAHVSNMENLD